MEEIKNYTLTQEEFKRLYKLAYNVCNTSVVVDFFCQNQPYIEELENITPIIKNLRTDADKMYAFFIDNDKEKQINI